jgi:UDP-glucose 4-epimerase
MGAGPSALYDASRPGDVRHSVADIGLARRDLGYEPTVTVREGLRRTVPFALTSEANDHDRHALRALTPVVTGRAPPAQPRRGSRRASRARRDGRRYLITGGAGFIGSHLAEALLAGERAATIVILDDLSTGRLENIHGLLRSGAVEFVEGSATDAGVLDGLMGSADVCVHLASAVGVQMIVDDPLRTLMQSVRASNVVMHSAHRHGVRVLFSSTSEVYGKHSSDALSEDDDLIIGSPAKGRWTYAIAKSYGEALIHGYRRRLGVDATVVRLFNSVGPRQTGAYGMVLPRFVGQALNDDDLTVYGSGVQTRCFTHVADTVAALVLLCEDDSANGRTFNVGSSTPVSILELAGHVIERAQSKSRIMLVPYNDAYGAGFEELGSRRPDTSALRQLTGWHPRRTVDDAIDDLIEFERNRGASNSEPVSRIVSSNVV